MKIRFKITQRLLDAMRSDLRRPHPIAHERIGFVAAGLAAAHDELLILARDYRPVDDEHYLDDPRVGAMIDASAIRSARQWAMSSRAAMFHVHSHGGQGIPGFSSVDNRENAKFIPNFVSVAPFAVHGAIVLSDTAAFGQVWLGRNDPRPFITTFNVIGALTSIWSAA